MGRQDPSFGFSGKKEHRSPEPPRRAGVVPHTQVIVNPLTFAHGALHALNTFPVIAAPGKGQRAPHAVTAPRGPTPPPERQPPLSLPFCCSEANLKRPVEAEVGETVTQMLLLDYPAGECQLPPAQATGTEQQQHKAGLGRAPRCRHRALLLPSRNSASQPLPFWHAASWLPNSQNPRSPAPASPPDLGFPGP